MWKYLVAWVPMVAIAVLNGAVRDAWYAKRTSELRAHQLSTASLLLLLGAYIWFIIGLLPPGSGAEALAVGLVWLVLTLAFEFLFGHFVARRAWSRILHDYNVLAGRIWLLVPMWVAIAPYAFLMLQRQ